MHRSAPVWSASIQLIEEYYAILLSEDFRDANKIKLASHQTTHSTRGSNKEMGEYHILRYEQFLLLVPPDDCTVREALLFLRV